MLAVGKSHPCFVLEEEGPGDPPGSGVTQTHEPVWGDAQEALPAPTPLFCGMVFFLQSYRTKRALSFRQTGGSLWLQGWRKRPRKSRGAPPNRQGLEAGWGCSKPQLPSMVAVTVWGYQNSLACIGVFRESGLICEHKPPGGRYLLLWFPSCYIYVQVHVRVNLNRR